MMRGFLWLVLISLAGCSSAPQKEADVIDPQTRQRVAEWKALIQAGKQWSDGRRLVAANDFVNRFDFVDDIYHWKKEDYWATPLQTVVTKGGDCEDFAIAKYFTLTSMGLAEDKLRLTYVKALNLNKAHMVVSYFEQPSAEPLVLDNLDPLIKPASQRQDLLPVYSFNGTGLWLAKRERSGNFPLCLVKLGFYGIADQIVQ